MNTVAIQAAGEAAAKSEFTADADRQPDPMELQAIRCGVAHGIEAYQNARIEELKRQLEELGQ